MKDKIETWKKHVAEVSSDPGFAHYEWFVQWHLEIVEQIALELCDKYPAANRDLVQVMVWLHDYGKALLGPFNEKEEYVLTTSAGTAKLTEIGFAPDFVEQAVSNIAHMNKKLEVDLHEAPLEVQIVASADGCSHMVGPFMAEYWRENAGLTADELLEANKRKLVKDWERKIVLPEAREAFATRRAMHQELAGQLPVKYLI